MNFLKQAASSMLNNVMGQIPLTATYAYTVKQLDSPQRFSSMTVVCRDTYMQLLKDPMRTELECVLYNPAVNQKPFSLFRLSDLTQARSEFLTLQQKLQPIYMSSFSCYNEKTLQKLCDCIRNHTSWTTAHIAVHCGVSDCLRNNEISRFLNSTQCDMKRTPLHLACMAGNVECMKALLESGARMDIQDTNGDTVYHAAATSDNKKIVEMLASVDPQAMNSQNFASETPLHIACRENKYANVRVMLRSGADSGIISRIGYPIHYAMKSSSTKSIAALLEVNPRSAEFRDARYGGTVLHWTRRAEDIEMLLQCGCSKDAVSKTGDTPLHVMVMKGRSECIMSLLCAEANVNIKGQNGSTPLHHAVQKEDLDLVYMLIVFGADVNAMNNQNNTPRHLLALNSTKNSKVRSQILYALNMVGAQRCHALMKSCNDWCRHDGQFNGDAIDPIQSHASLENQAYDDFLALNVVAAAMKRHTAGKPMDEVDSASAKRNFDTVLSLDGGGIRGLILIQLLLAIEQYARRPIRDMFDWIGGTSTGGILALAIVHGRSLREIQGFYFKLKNEVFQGKRPYASEPLERVMKEEFGEHTTMDAVQHPKVLVTGVLGDRNPPALHFFRNFEAPPTSSVDQLVNKEPAKFTPPPKPHEQLVWMAARSSGAAPTYFRSVGRFLDGGLVANNPTLDVLTEIHEYNMHLKQQGLDEMVRKLGVVISLGTGKIPIKKVGRVDVFWGDGIIDTAKSLFGIKNLAEIMLEQVTESAYRPVDKSRAWCNMIDVPFYRFNPQLSAEVLLDETNDSVLVKMLWETQVYIYQNRHKFEQLAVLLNS
ncbi:85/88 kDa calcium-independent phospholipase A2-like [Ptychodera flava]|uniref:85/88 kDa calcium-independent phospholipase A2-like n=1 Tax=Ptychodera flava TaxID=63121 RepID=UPI00396A6930